MAIIIFAISTAVAGANITHHRASRCGPAA